MTKPVKVVFKKKVNGKTYTSYGYYVSEEDFKERNGSMTFVRLTKQTKPVKKTKKAKETT